VDARTYYPADYAGQNVPLAAGTARFPVVVFGHGYQITVEYYNYLWQALVPRGYFVVLADTETVLFPSHGEFGRDLAFLVDQFQAEGVNPASPLYSRVASRSAVMGHSMGGGASFLAVQHSANITTMVTLAAANTNPSAIDAAAGIVIPALVFAGSSDCVAPPNSHQVPMFNGLSSTCKYYISITQGSHCQFAQGSGLCELGETFACPFRQYVADATQKALAVSFAAAWLDFHLKNQASAWSTFTDGLDIEQAAGRIAYTGACVLPTR